MISSVIGQVEQIFIFPLIFFILIFGLILFVISILLCVWVYRNAESRGMNGALWLIIVLFTGIIGLIIYLVVREDVKTKSAILPMPPTTGKPTRYCTNCGHQASLDMNFCPNCGKTLTPSKDNPIN